MNTRIKSKTIVFIHGLFMNPVSWSEWIDYFEGKGYTCYAPAYPFHEGNPVALRNIINTSLGNITFELVVY
jgi:esterase/lipase